MPRKACSNLAILDLMRRHGVLVDAVSAGEIHRALAAGYQPGGQPPPQIVYTADIFDHEALRLVLEHDIHVNCGSPDMIDQLGEVRPRPQDHAAHQSRLRPRPQPEDQHRRRAVQARHLARAACDDCLRHAPTTMGWASTGLHMHIGSGTDLEHLAQVCAAMEKAAMAVGRSVTSISAGGGLPIPYRPNETHVDLDGYFELWDATRKRLERAFGHPVSLEIEPGRYLSAESGYLVAEIRAVKQTGGHVFYLLDAGFNNLARPILYGAYHPMAIAPRDGDLRRDVAGGGRGRPAVRVGRHLHAGRGWLRAAAPLAGGRGRRLAGDRMRRGLRVS